MPNKQFVRFIFNLFYDPSIALSLSGILLKYKTYYFRGAFQLSASMQIDESYRYLYDQGENLENVNRIEKFLLFIFKSAQKPQNVLVDFWLFIRSLSFCLRLKKKCCKVFPLLDDQIS